MEFMELPMKYWFIVSRGLDGSINNDAIEAEHPATYASQYQEKIIFYQEIDSDTYRYLCENL